MTWLVIFVVLYEKLQEIKKYVSDTQEHSIHTLVEALEDEALDVLVNKNLHDREIKIDNGWTIKIGRGLDIYQKPDSWFSIGVYDQALKKCRETNVDIYKS